MVDRVRWRSFLGFLFLPLESFLKESKRMKRLAEGRRERSSRNSFKKICQIYYSILKHQRPFGWEAIVAIRILLYINFYLFTS